MKKINYLSIGILILGFGLLFGSYRYWEFSRKNVRFGENYSSYFYSFLFALDDLLTDEKLFIIPLGKSGELEIDIIEVDDSKILILKFDNNKYFSESSVNILSALSGKLFENLRHRMELYSENNEREEVRKMIFRLLWKYQKGIPKEYFDSIMKLSQTKGSFLQEGKSFTIELSDSESLTLVWVEPGEFYLGSPENEDGRLPNEGPLTKVHLTQGFWLGATPVTQGQWEAVMGTTLEQTRKEAAFFWEQQADQGGIEVEGKIEIDERLCRVIAENLRGSKIRGNGSNFPMHTVSYYQAVAFTEKLTEMKRSAGQLSEEYEFSLPSEAQWEFAARAGSQDRWWFGNNEEDLINFAWFRENNNGGSRPVGQKPANPWSFYDVHGNIYEWTRSWYGEYPGGSEVDFEGPSAGSYRVFRGGSWFDPAVYTRAAIRGKYPPGFRMDNLGFRIVLIPSVTK